MNHAAKDAVELIEQLKLKQRDNHNIRPLSDHLLTIIAGLDLLRGVAEGTHVIRPIEPTEAMIDAAMGPLANLYPAFPGEKEPPTAGEMTATVYRAMITENE